MRSDKELEKIAKEELEKASLYSTPTDIIKLAQYNGFTVFEQNLFGYSGAVLVNDEDGFKLGKQKYKRIILVSESDFSPKRKRFTVAHELAHYFLEPDKKMLAYRDVAGEATSEAESEVNRLASELLMPTQLLNNFIQEVKKEYSTNYETMTSLISDKFCVSLSAAQVRYDKYLRKSGVPR